MYEHEQVNLIGKLGADMGDLKAIRKYAAIALSKVDPTFALELGKKGALESAATILLLARHGQRLAHRARLSDNA